MLSSCEVGATVSFEYAAEKDTYKEKRFFEMR